MRYALYFTPPADDPLTVAASRWLGRDAFRNEVPPRRGIAGIEAGELAFLTAAPRRYGFHATLKAPFALADGTTEAELLAALDAFAADRACETGPRLSVGVLDGFFALVPAEHSRALHELADAVVRDFDRFRAPLSDGDFERRNPARLTSDELKKLTLWGYPYVFETFRFHMTLTGRVEPAQASRTRAAIVEHFGRLLDAPLELSALALFVEPQPGEPFVVRSLHWFGKRLSKRFA